MRVGQVSKFLLLSIACGAAFLTAEAAHAAQAAQATKYPQTFRDCSNGCPEMVVVPQGRFTMGAPAGEEERENLPDQVRGRSVPQHLVTIRHKFAIGKFDVTRDEYAQFVAETHRPDPDSCMTAGPSGSGFIATNGKMSSRTPIAALRLLLPEPSLPRTAIGILQAIRKPEEIPSSVWVGTMHRPMCLG